MEYIGRVLHGVKNVYNELNPATLSGAIDVIVIEQPDGSLLGSPFHVRFGKLNLVRSREKIINIEINDELIDVKMKLGSAGEAFFVAKCERGVIPRNLATSPLIRSVPPVVDGLEPLVLSSPTSFESPKHCADYCALPESDFLSSSALSASVAQMQSESLPAEPPPLPGDSYEPQTQPGGDAGIETSDRITNQSRELTVQMGDERLLLSYEEDCEGKEGSKELAEVTWGWGHLPEKKTSVSSSPTSFSMSMQTAEAKASRQKWVWRGLLNIFSKEKKPSEKSPLYLGLGASPAGQPPPEVAVLSLEELASGCAEEPQNPPHASTLHDDSLLASDSATAPNCDQEPRDQALLAREVATDKKSFFDTVDLSLCKSILMGMSASEEVATTFDQRRLSFNTFSANPNVLKDPELVVRIANNYYDWEVASVIIMSKLAFGMDPPKSYELLQYEQSSVGAYCPQPSDLPDKMPDFPEQLVSSSPCALQGHSPPELLTAEAGICSFGIGDCMNKEGPFYKTLRMPPEALSRLPLKPGANKARFFIVTKMQGTAECFCNIYRWSYKDKIVISDIDGTITKSDALGHLLYVLGKDWTQSGVAQLYSIIRENGYKLLYLSSRAIGQANLTRYYLQGVKQQGLRLPDGPVLLSPDRLVTSLHREVIRKKPEEFKIACLRDIRDLFPSNCNAFYAGFGNRLSDHISYKAVGVPSSRIFIINSCGQVRSEDHTTFSSTYFNLSELAPAMFSPRNELDANYNITETFNDFNYWNFSPFQPELLNLAKIPETCAYNET
ncbi:phosphatidate phosphatase LPIN1-like isoform X2 [Zophobas morio]|uniref:phosphatidate phosphatase LPIN1-like isoform X2 n=1 Tax=Zophobas morio TaxID=2755281 RepID=UPI00308339CC